ncbi:unnamed protein product [Arctogadus glacialis]
MELPRPEYHVLVFLLSLCLSTPGDFKQGLRNVFSFQGQEMIWTEAQFTCKATNGTGLHRLANVRNTSELDDTWYRTDGEENVLPLQPGKSELERCAIVYQDNLHTHNCNRKMAHICEKYFFVLVKEEKSWEEALLHCRAMGVDKGLLPGSYDLLSLHTHDDLSYAQEELVHAGTREVWVSLRWLAGRWLWIDGEEHSVWECPADWTHCGSLSRQRLDARSCMEKRNFFCQRVNAVE